MTEQLDLFTTTTNESKLTPKQWELYRLIYHNSMFEHRKTTQKEICDTISGYEWDNSETCHDHCSSIWKDITENNLSFEHDKIIISKNFEYWIGSESETQEFIDGLWKQLQPRLMRYWLYKQKVAQNGQGKLLSNQLNPIDIDSKARTFIESYNPYDISGGYYE